jgi:hypothetical protein
MMTVPHGMIIRPRGARPSGRAAAATLGAGAMFGVSATIRLAALRGEGRTSEAAAITAIAVAVGLVCWTFYFLYRTNASVALRDGLLYRRNALGKISILSVEGLRTALRLSVRFNSLGAASPQLMFIGRDGRCHLRIYTSLYDEEDLVRLCSAAGIPLSGSWTDEATARATRRRYPGSYSWWLAHPWILALAISMVAGTTGVVIASH